MRIPRVDAIVLGSILPLERTSPTPFMFRPNCPVTQLTQALSESGYGSHVDERKRIQHTRVCPAFVLLGLKAHAAGPRAAWR